MKIKNLLIATLAIFGLTSCLGGSNDDQHYIAALSDCINYVENTQSGDVNVTGGAKYSIDVNITQSTLDLVIDGVQLTPGGGSLVLNLKDIPCSYDKDGNLVASTLTYTSGSNTITNFSFKMRQRYLNATSYIPVFDVTFNINGSYFVRTFQSSTFYFGTTNVQVINTSTQTNTDKTFYTVTFDKTKIGEGSNVSANLYIYSAKFADKMPKMDLMIFNIPAKLGRDGYTLAGDNLKVYTGTVTNPVEQPDYPVTGLTGTGIITKGLILNFTVASRFILSADLGYSFTEGVIEDLQ